MRAFLQFRMNYLGKRRSLKGKFMTNHCFNTLQTASVQARFVEMPKGWLFFVKRPSTWGITRYRLAYTCILYSIWICMWNNSVSLCYLSITKRTCYNRFTSGWKNKNNKRALFKVTLVTFDCFWSVILSRLVLFNQTMKHFTRNSCNLCSRWDVKLVLFWGTWTPTWNDFSETGWSRWKLLERTV